MPQTNWKTELRDFLKQKHKKPRVVLMPDLFHDRLIALNYNVNAFSSLLKDIAERKGGSIDDIEQADIRGGNATNTASALAALGANVTPIVCTNKMGIQKLKLYFARYHVDLSYVKNVEKASLTTAFELQTENGKTNIMLRDLGNLADFGPSDLLNRDYEMIEKADYVFLSNWAGTKKYGTQLAEAVFRRVKTKGKGKTYYDTADPTPNKAKIPELVQRVLKTSYVNILSLNENEAVYYASLLTETISDKHEEKRFDELAMEASKVLAKHLEARIDLHTTAFSATITKKSEIIVPSFKLKALRATGAGDAWNAGNILGDANMLSDECRLALANAVAACYLVNPEGSHPTTKELAKFIEHSTINN
jgi:sugar/nucleoside kinase (ribokinase family)